jgi:hypothetical protein
MVLESVTVPCPESEDLWRLITITSTVFSGNRVANIELEEDDVELHPVVVVERRDGGDEKRDGTMPMEEEHVVTVWRA